MQNQFDYSLEYLIPNKGSVSQVLKLTVAFANQNRTDNLISDVSWKVTNSPIVNLGYIYNGKVYDNREPITSEPLLNTIVTGSPIRLINLPEIPPIT